MKTTITVLISLAVIVMTGCSRDTASQSPKEASAEKASSKKNNSDQDAQIKPVAPTASAKSSISKSDGSCTFLDKSPKGKGGDVLLWTDTYASDGKQGARKQRKLASVETLTKVLEKGDEKTRLKAVFTLSVIGDSPAVPPLRKALSDASKRIRYEAVVALGGIDDPSVIPVLAEALKDNDGRVRDEAIASLGDIRDKNVIPVLIDALESEFEELVDEAVLTLNFLTEEGFGKDAAKWRAWWQAKGEDFDFDIEN